MAFTTSRAGNATGLMRSLCSLMPISITLVSCSSSYAAAAAAGTSSGGGSSRGFALNARGGASEEEASTPVCSPRDSETNKHSFRSMVRSVASVAWLLAVGSTHDNDVLPKRAALDSGIPSATPPRNDYCLHTMYVVCTKYVSIHFSPPTVSANHLHLHLFLYDTLPFPCFSS